MQHKNLSFGLFLGVASSSLYAEALASRSIYDLTLKELMAIKVVSIATGTEKTLEQAPAIASVITRDDIESMSADSLFDVLATIPGIHVTRSAELSNYKIIIRGIASKYTPHTLLLLNGTPMTSVVRGDRGLVFPQFHLNSVERIEIIRGPGSALYGADAFAGVINIITKSAKSSDDLAFGASYGSFSTTQGWGSVKGKIAEVDLALNVDFTQTDGSQQLIDSDAQSKFDDLGISAVASFAPGPINEGYRNLDLMADFAYQNFGLKLGFMETENMGTGSGISEALDPQGKVATERLMVQMNYQQAIDTNTKAHYQVSYYRNNQRVEALTFLLPPGAIFGAFEDGVIGAPEYWEYSLISQAGFEFNGWASHILSWGMGYREQNVYRVRERKNFDSHFEPFPAGVVDVSDTAEVYMPESNRENFFAYLQDQYQIATDWHLTAGVRADRYSDFGLSVNPRLALVWQSSEKLSAKLLYGRAFRAPAFAEQLIVNNPVTLGDPNIAPEIIDTIEAALTFRFSPTVVWMINSYWYDFKDQIEFVRDENGLSATAQNIGRYQGTGIESDLTVQLTKSLDWLFNYAWQRSTRYADKINLAGAPNHQYYTRLNWRATEQLSFNGQIAYVSRQHRNPIDGRKPVDAYTDVALAVRYRSTDGSWTSYFRVDNLLDADIRHPSNGPSSSGELANIPNDFPQPGRNYSLGLERRF